MTDREQLIEEAAKAIAEFAAQDGPVDAFHLAKVLYGRFEKAQATDWEYGQSEVLADGTVAFGSPVATIEQAIRRRDIDRANYPWPEELGIGRRRSAGPWEPVPDDDTTPKEEA